uniref:Uncharacterized protein n=1 Tax=Odontella aurita TaxID=265563 RepID=A0A7S4MZF9_9STRA|mmetsp:Transcript_4155/g.11454  ORF Transcript_4155/g.11454 Transcript_4155/m.11454 type:complete len:103 (+) Transcript_4155:457-765(+)
MTHLSDSQVLKIPKDFKPKLLHKKHDARELSCKLGVVAASDKTKTFPETQCLTLSVPTIKEEPCTKHCMFPKSRKNPARSTSATEVYCLCPSPSFSQLSIVC